MADLETLEPGTALWVPDKTEVWRLAKLISCNTEELKVEIDGIDDALEKEVTLVRKTTRWHIRNQVLLGDGPLAFEDLTLVPDLHEPAVLYSLQKRFDHDKIYTLIGPILIAVNPYRTLPGLYSAETLQAFVGEVRPKPHVFSVASKALRAIADRCKSQTVLISGESGAGKTETTKFVMKFFALADKDGSHSEMSRVECQVLDSNPLLEAFGNAKTLRNENSSRFGKYIELQFGVAARGIPPRLGGAKIHTYLLEKVRVTDQHEGERSFHIFYQALAGAQSLSSTSGVVSVPRQDGGAFEVDLCGFLDKKVESFEYLTRSTCKTLTDANDTEEFRATLKAMQTIGLNHSQVNSIFRTLAAVLHIGNVSLKAPNNNSEGSEVVDRSDGPVSVVGAYLGVTSASLEEALCWKTMKTPNEGEIRSSRTVAKAYEARDALARFLYHAVFVHIVQATNSSIGSLSNALFCGVLDIFGFEFFKHNSLEQLCINLTNELLQQFFNSFIFQKEEQLYIAEGIDWNPSDFPNNEVIVDLLNKNLTGIFPMLDEECAYIGGTSATWFRKLVNQHERHKNFSVIKHREDVFVVQHFAGPVEYTADGFLEKNRDELSQGLLACMKNSSFDFVRNLLRASVQDKTSTTQVNSMTSKALPTPIRKKTHSVSSEFRGQLKELMLTMSDTEPSFVRCLKPNHHSRPRVMDRSLLAEQLRYQGVLPAIEVSRAGYPIRLLHKEFLLDFSCLAPARRSSKETPKEAAQSLLARLQRKLLAGQEGGWAVGKSRVFLKQHATNILRGAMVDIRMRLAVKMQAAWRRYKTQKWYRRLVQLRNSSATTLQARYRCHRIRTWYKLERIERNKASTLVQKCWRGHKVKLWFTVEIEQHRLWLAAEAERVRLEKEAREEAERLRIAKEAAAAAEGARLAEEAERIRRLEEEQRQREAEQARLAQEADRLEAQRRQRERVADEARRKEKEQKELQARFAEETQRREQEKTDAQARIDALERQLQQANAAASVVDPAMKDRILLLERDLKRSHEAQAESEAGMQQMQMRMVEQQLSEAQANRARIEALEHQLESSQRITAAAKAEAAQTRIQALQQELEISQKSTAQEILLEQELERSQHSMAEAQAEAMKVRVQAMEAELRHSQINAVAAQAIAKDEMDTYMQAMHAELQNSQRHTAAAQAAVELQLQKGLQKAELEAETVRRQAALEERAHLMALEQEVRIYQDAADEAQAEKAREMVIYLEQEMERTHKSAEAQNQMGAQLDVMCSEAEETRKRMAMLEQELEIRQQNEAKQQAGLAQVHSQVDVLLKSQVSTNMEDTKNLKQEILRLRQKLQTFEILNPKVIKPFAGLKSFAGLSDSIVPPRIVGSRVMSTVMPSTPGPPSSRTCLDASVRSLNGTNIAPVTTTSSTTYPVVGTRVAYGGGISYVQQSPVGTIPAAAQFTATRIAGSTAPMATVVTQPGSRTIIQSAHPQSTLPRTVRRYN